MKKKAVQIIGLVIGPFLVMLVIMYLLYPHLNEEKHQQYMQEIETAELTETAEEGSLERDFSHLTTQIDLLMQEQQDLQEIIDSLRSEKEILQNEIAELNISGNPNQDDLPKELIEEAGSADDIQTQEEFQASTEEFSERVKSLLNLEEEELAPIVRQLSDEQLIRLYNSAGNIQREKLLRSLSADRAAKLMEKIML